MIIYRLLLIRCEVQKYWDVRTVPATSVRLERRSWMPRGWDGRRSHRSSSDVWWRNRKERPGGELWEQRALLCLDYCSAEWCQPDSKALRCFSVMIIPNSLLFSQQWFTRLPPVLTFELSRFHFNTSFGRPEKIHNRLEFPEMLYLDRLCQIGFFCSMRTILRLTFLFRYLECNKCAIKLKRQEVKKLKQQLNALQLQLDKYDTVHAIVYFIVLLVSKLQYCCQVYELRVRPEEVPARGRAAVRPRVRS